MRTVLLVDDEADIREVGRLSLELHGDWTVRTADDGHQALELALTDRPDAILLDVMMPGLDGPAVVEQLRGREATREIPVVLLTAKTQAADRQRFLELGVTGVLTKPFDPMTLAEDLARVLGWPR